MPNPPAPSRTPPPSKALSVAMPALPDTGPVVVSKNSPATTSGPVPDAPSAVRLSRALQAQFWVGNAAVAASLLGVPPGGVPAGGLVPGAAGPGPAVAGSGASVTVVPGQTIVSTSPVGVSPVVPGAGVAPAGSAPAGSAPAGVGPAVLPAVGTAPVAPTATPAAPAAPAAALAAGPAAPAGPAAAPAMPARPTADHDPKFAVLKRDVQTKKRHVASSHPPPTTESGAAQAAARPPADDKVAQGKVANADKMNDAKPKEFDKAAFVKAVEQAIAQQAPKNLDEADKFADSDKPEQVKKDVQARVGQGKQASAAEIATTTAAPPDTSKAVEKKVVPLSADRPPGAPATPDPANAVPDKLPPSATDLSAGPRDVNRQMADAQVTEPQLANSNEPTFKAAVQQKHAMEQDSAQGTPAMRQHEAATLKAATNDAQHRGATGMQGLAADRVATGQKVNSGKQGAKGSDEGKRAQVTATLQRVFDATKKDVEDILSGLDKKVDDQFTREEKQARDAFTAEHRQKMKEYKDKRYGGWEGKLRWVRDKFLGLPEEANQIFTTARDHYITRMQTVISDVADTIGTELNRAKARIAKGRQDLQDAVKKLPADLQAIGRQAAADFADKFDELNQEVDQKGTDLVQTLASKYNEALKSVDDEIAKEKEKNQGLVAKAVGAVKGVIQTIMELKNLLLGVLAKAASAVMLILKDPIGFLRNLVSAVGAGLRQFLKNIVRHLEQGLVSWLLGVTAQAGLSLPKSFDIKGILMLLAGLLGLTWQFIRSRIVRKIPEKVVAAVETGVELLMKIRREGIVGLWDEIKARIGDLKHDLIGKVTEYLVPTIIMAGIMWVLSLLNPASAFVRACKLIIDIVQFIVQRARQIIDFVNAVLDAVIAIAKGGSGGVPGLIENALARSIPVLIGFLASLLGIGGIADKVKKIFEALSKPVMKAVDWVVDKIVGLVKKLWAKLKARLRKVKEKLRRPRRSARPGGPRKPTRDRRPERGQRDKAHLPDRDSQGVLRAALEAAERLADRSGDEQDVRGGLPAIRAGYHLSGLTVVVRPGAGAQLLYRFTAEINPRATLDHLAADRPLRLAKDAYGRGPFAIEDMPGASPGVVVPGLTATLGLSAAQARRYVAKWQSRDLLDTATTSRGRHIYNFVTFTAPADLIVPRDHREYRKWIDKAGGVGIPEPDADRYWYLVLEGIRDGKKGNFEIVAADMMRGMRMPPGRGSLWSGGVDLSEYAVRQGYLALEQLPFLQQAQYVNLLTDFPAISPMWEVFSRRYAAQLRAQVHVFVRRLESPSVLVDIELVQVNRTGARLGVAIPVRYHAMEWGDDPRQKLDFPVPGYWREMRADGTPLAEGQIMELDMGSAQHATRVARQRFLDKQARK